MALQSLRGKTMSAVLEEDRLGETIRTIVGNTAKAVETNPNAGRLAFSAKSELVKGLKATNKVRKFEFISDEPQSLGGTDEGANPVEYILAALASCQEIVISAYAHALGIAFEKVEVEVKGELDLRGFFNLADVRPGFDTIVLNTKVITNETDPEKLNQLRHLAKNNCPVLDIIKNPVPVSESLEFSQR